MIDEKNSDYREKHASIFESINIDYQEPDSKGKKRKSRKNIERMNRRPVLEIMGSVIIAIVLTIVIRMFLIAPYYVPTGSMIPTLNVNDRIIVNKIVYDFSQPKRGDIIVFKYPQDKSLNYVKRVIALPGETVSIMDNTVYIDGKVLSEPYLSEKMDYEDYPPEKVPSGAYFVLGDNRGNSKDSRNWGFVPEENVIGKAYLTYWPIDQFGLIH